MRITLPVFIRVVKVISINIAIIVIIDLVFGLFVTPLPQSLNKGRFKFESYPTNYRNYFTKALNQFGEEYYQVDYSDWINSEQLFNDPLFNGIRVASFGDSFTEGQGVKPKDKYTNMLSVLTNDKIRALNKGVSGSGVYDVGRAIQSFAPNFQVDLITYGYVLNDPMIRGNVTPYTHFNLTRKQQQKHGDIGLAWDFINLRTTALDAVRHPVAQFFYSYSNIFAYIWGTLERNAVTENTIKFYQEAHSFDTNNVGLYMTIDEILKMKQKAEALKSEFLVMIFPIYYWTKENYPFKKAHDTLKKALTDRGIKVVDLAPLFTDQKPDTFWVHPVDQHPNDYAHNITAKYLSEWIFKNIKKIKE